MNILEIFCSIQGEGRNTGRLATFVRLWGCNLNCSWCDTEYAWKPNTIEKAIRMPVETVANMIQNNPTRHIVFTGGEPLLQKDEIAEVMKSLPSTKTFEIETNGTQKPITQEIQRKIQYSVSPKLSNSGIPHERRRKIDTLEYFVSEDAIFKFVISEKKDLNEVIELKELLNIPKWRIWLMPKGKTKEGYRKNLRTIVELAVENGFNFSPRLHIEVWDNVRGR